MERTVLKNKASERDPGQSHTPQTQALHSASGRPRGHGSEPARCWVCLDRTQDSEPWGSNWRG